MDIYEHRRLACIQLLIANDPNGIWSDEDSYREGVPPMSVTDAIVRTHRCVRDMGGWDICRNIPSLSMYVQELEKLGVYDTSITLEADPPQK